MIKSIVFYTTGGLFTAFFANGVRMIPMFHSRLEYISAFYYLCLLHFILLDPRLHIACASVGFLVGYMIHRYEENSEERIKRLIETYPDVPVQWTIGFENRPEAKPKSKTLIRNVQSRAAVNF